MSSARPIAVFGCKANTAFIVDGLLERGLRVHLITLSPEGGERQRVADYANLRAHYAGSAVPIYSVASYRLTEPADLDFFRNNAFALGFVNGWQRLLPAAVLDTFSTGVFGMHGSAADLPRGRGRSPLNWSIIEGRRAFYTNLFRYDAGVDSGQILATHKFAITSRDTAETLHFKNTLAMRHLIDRHIDALLTGRFQLRPQPTVTPTYYPKRTESDSLIDWSMDLHQIDRHVRAVTRPFNGAYTYAGTERLVILRAAPFDPGDFGFTAAAPGRVVTVFPNGKFLVRCSGGLLLVHEYAGQVTEGDQLHNGPETIRPFPRNATGGFDLP